MSATQSDVLTFTEERGSTGSKDAVHNNKETHPYPGQHTSGLERIPFNVYQFILNILHSVFEISGCLSLMSHLTARKAGLMATQHTLQNNPGALPSMAWMSLLNLLIPGRKQH